MKFVTIGSATIIGDACVMNVNVPVKVLMSKDPIRFSARENVEILSAHPPHRPMGTAKIPMRSKSITIDLAGTNLDDRMPTPLEIPLVVTFKNYCDLLSGKQDTVTIETPDT